MYLEVQYSVFIFLNQIMKEKILKLPEQQILIKMLVSYLYMIMLLCRQLMVLDNHLVQEI